MSIRIGNEAPDFTADSTEGQIRFHEWIGDHWAILFSHPKDFTPVCTTELGYVARLKPEFDSRNTKVIGLSVDPVSDHKRWAGDIEETQGHAINYPLIGDDDLTVAKLYDMIHPNASVGARTANDNATARSLSDGNEQRDARGHRPRMPFNPRVSEPVPSEPCDRTRGDGEQLLGARKHLSSTVVPLVVVCQTKFDQSSMMVNLFVPRPTIATTVLSAWVFCDRRSSPAGEQRARRTDTEVFRRDPANFLLQRMQQCLLWRISDRRHGSSRNQRNSLSLCPEIRFRSL